VNLGHANKVVLSQSEEIFYTGYTIYADSYYYSSDLALLPKDRQTHTDTHTHRHTHTNTGGTVWGNRSPEERGKTSWLH
jgi:hypothetical protein